MLFLWGWIITAGLKPVNNKEPEFLACNTNKRFTQNDSMFSAAENYKHFIYFQ
jgi:hypothetical protein